MAIVFGLLAFLISPTAAIVGGARNAGGLPIVMIVGSRGNEGILCTGTALAPDLVLTAAHCAPPNARLQIMSSTRSGLIPVRAATQHPRYDSESYRRGRVTADLALVKLAAPLPGPLMPALLAADSEAVAVGERIAIAGFGMAMQGNETTTGVARLAALVVTGKPGSLQFRLVDPATRGARAGLGACTGDSGGPAFRETNGTLGIIGVVSWSTGPADSEGCGGMTGVTPLALYRSWLIEQASRMGHRIGQ